jgi:ATP-dependent helicase/nuclease subunit A
MRDLTPERPALRPESAAAAPVCPQDPYSSYLVAASAGSGKTYQLSRRFLFLVGAGAAPASILTVTFTKKAAGEMRSRILEDAVRLVSSPAQQAAFARDQADFYRAAHTAPDRDHDWRLAPPRSPLATGRAVLAASQLLRISTIDSLFLEWVSKFPYEAGAPLPGDEAADGGAASGLPSPFRLTDPWRLRELEGRAWQATCRLLSHGLARDDAALAALVAGLGSGDLAGVEARLQALNAMETFLWHCEHQDEESGGEGALRSHALPPEAALYADEAALMTAMAVPLRAIAAQLGQDERRQRCERAIAAADLEALFATELVTRTRFGVNGALVRGKKRATLAGEIAQVEGALRAHQNQRRLSRLTAQGAAHYALYRCYRGLRDHLKQAAGLVEFADLAKGCFRLFRGDAGLGVRFLLARTTQHVLLDEFQDTSRLQWAIFHELAAQLLAGDGVEASADGGGGPPPSVFIVGDEKQSIYAFREADPAVLGEAATRFSGRLRRAPLNESDRTAQVVLDFVNGVFGGGALSDFPRHTTAAPAGTPFLPDCGRVVVAPLLAEPPVSRTGPTPVEPRRAAAREAALIATMIATALDGAVAELHCPVYDKERQAYRALQPSDCAVLYRSTTNADLYEDALRARGLACQREEERGFFARPEITDTVALLRWLALPSDLPALLGVLRSPLGRLPDPHMLMLLEATRGDPSGDRSRSGQRCQSLLQALRSGPAPHDALGSTLSDLAARTGRCLPHELLTEALDRLHAFAAYARPEVYGAAEARRARRNLCRLLELCMQLEDSGQTSLIAIVQRLDFLAQRDETGCAETGDAGISLMTIHKAKGLEFPLVVLADAGRPWGKRDHYWVQGRDAAGHRGVFYAGAQAERPVDDAAFDVLVGGVDAAIAAECQRLLYVALTRARQYLFVTGHAALATSGVPGTTAHPALSAALAPTSDRTVRLSEALIIGGITLQQWACVPAASWPLPAPAVPAAPVRAGATVEGPPSWDEALPSELRLVSPSRHVDERRQGASGRLRLRSDVERSEAVQIGLFLHAGLETHTRGGAFDPAATWLRLAGSAARPFVQRLALAQWQAVLADPQLASRLQAAVRIDAELPIVHLDGTDLVYGTIDLLLTGADGQRTVVDYKTSLLLPTADGRPLTDQELAAFCHERGYDAQLATYARAVRAMTPGAEVNCAVYFTSLGRFLTLPT